MKRFFTAVLFFCISQSVIAGMDEADEAMSKGDFNIAFTEYLPLAKNGNAVAQERIGELYRRGLGVKQDYAESFAWYLKSAQQNSAEGQYFVAVLYKNGAGVAKNDQEAESWYLKSANQGHLGAQVSLGQFYMAKGNFSEGLKWLRKTAGQGHIGSILTLGEAHYYGDGVSKDAVKAYRYFHIASHFGRKADEESAAVAQKNKDVLSAKLSDKDKKQAELQASGFPFEGAMRQKSLE